MLELRPVTPALAVSDLRKSYGRTEALRGVALEVGQGELFGLLGPNGAGKSTLVKIIMTIIRPTHAQGTVLAKPVGHKQTLGRIGYLPENHRFPKYLSGRQVIEFFGALATVDRRTRKRRAAELVELVGMRDDADRPVGSYSKGMAQRIGLAQALVNDPDLVLLDEPTDGVDPVGRRDIRDVLQRLRAQGKTVFINSHLLSELEMISDRVAILVAGQVATQGTLHDLTLSKQRYEIEVLTSGPPPLLPPRADFPPFEIRRNIISVATTDAQAVQPILDALRAGGVVIQRVQPVRPSLEDLFIEAVGMTGGRQ